MTTPPNQQRRKLLKRLVFLFLAWKSTLLVLAALSPGPGYDTSSLVLSCPSHHRYAKFNEWTIFNRFTLNLFRWDAFYFVTSSQRGYVYEQEWAFSWAYSLVLRTASRLFRLGASPSLWRYIWSGVFLSNICHFISVLVLFRLLTAIWGARSHPNVPFLASSLHILSPAGLFLSAPYTESLFAMLNFAGMLCYVLARNSGLNKKQALREDALLIISGILFAVATAIRSNGLLSGLIFVYDVVCSVPRMLKWQLSRSDARRVSVTGFAGALMAFGSVIPQYVAYREFCVTNPDLEARPWCRKMIPSIYSWVQSHYWNVGFLRYWTISNLPLFLIAAPMLWLLVESSVEHLCYAPLAPPKPAHKPRAGGQRDAGTREPASECMPQLVLPQLLLSVAAITSFHVQVINRISSGYPIWYLTVAQWLVMRESRGRKSQIFIRGMIIYAIVQGVLFASFLPPA